MTENQMEYSRLEQKSLIKFLVTENCKSCEIYTRMCDLYGEAYLVNKNVYKWAKHGFATICLVEKKVMGVETH